MCGKRGVGTLAVSAFIFEVLGSVSWVGAPNFPPHDLGEFDALKMGIRLLKTGTLGNKQFDYLCFIDIYAFFMPNLADIPKKIEALRRLSEKDVVYLDDLQKEFRQDLQNFIFGETLTLHGGKPAIGRFLFRRWLQKISTRGFDYEIDFKQ
jgi:hypothetical protein